MTTQIIMAAHDGHLYAAIGFPRALSWTTVDSFVQTGFETGTADWHLATVSSAAENRVLTGLLDQTKSFFAFFGL